MIHSKKEYHYFLPSQSNTIQSRALPNAFPTTCIESVEPQPRDLICFPFIILTLPDCIPRSFARNDIHIDFIIDVQYCTRITSHPPPQEDLTYSLQHGPRFTSEAKDASMFIPFIHIICFLSTILRSNLTKPYPTIQIVQPSSPIHPFHLHSTSSTITPIFKLSKNPHSRITA